MVPSSKTPTEVVSGRSPENRGNGLKFVAHAIKSQKWSLKFVSGDAQLIIDRLAKMTINKNKDVNPGCLAVINYGYEN